MPFLLLFVLTPPCLQDTWPEPGFGITSPLWAAGLTWAAVAVPVLAAALAVVLVRRQVRRHPGRRDAWVERYAGWRVYHFLALAVLYGVGLYVFGWGWAVEKWLGLPSLPPGAELLILAPFLTALGLSWNCFYSIERALHGAPAGATDRYWTRGQYLGYQLRNNLALVFLPLLLLVALKALRWVATALAPVGDNLISVLSIGLAVALVIAMPWLLRLVLGLKPLPDGPLRQRLLGASRRLRFRCSDILMWNTRGNVANALVAGVFPVLRYVVLTDRLIAELTPEEIEAVFGHEVGHVKHRHMLYYLGFLLVSMAAVWAVVAVYVRPHVSGLSSLADRDDLAVLSLVGFLGLYVFVVFGFVSRNCERQADLFGCRAVSCTRADCQGHDGSAALPPNGAGLCPTGICTFITALEKVCDLNGISRDRPGLLQSWQHSTPARRVSFLRRVIAEPTTAGRFQRGVALLKGALLISLLAVILLLCWLHGWDKLLF